MDSVEEENYSPNIECSPLGTNELTDQELSIKVTESETYKSGFSTVQAYSVSTAPQGWTVQRSYSDFLWLRNALHVRFPHYILPMLPPEKDKYQELKAKKKSKFLNLFINKLAQIKTVRCTGMLQIFLKEQNRQDFRGYKDGVKNSSKPARCADLQSINGKVKTSEEDNSEYFYQYTRLVTPFDSCLKILAKQAQIIVKKSEDLQEEMKAFADNCESLAVFEWIENNLSEASKELFKGISDEFNVLYNRVKTENNLIQTHLSFTLDYLSFQMKPLKKMMKESVNLQKSFNKLRDTKEKKEEIGKPVKEKHVDKMMKKKEFLGVFNYHCKKQLDKRLESILETLKNEYEAFKEQINNDDPIILS